ncbi:hypothetical protein ACP70R_040777 [Stipagrostis hirtigluma subsp. patula]
MTSGGGSQLTDVKLEERRIPASRCCASCGQELSYKLDMVGLPAGVKFDPSDQELIEHLQAMVNEGGARAHPLIHDFIPTIQGEDGICYTHPENLPGVTRDGLSKHFFHMPSKAYTTGTRKRRKIQAERGLHGSEDVVEARWHKTGKTRPVIVGDRQKGCKKILVLYTNFGKNGKPEKTNWVMHQYHLGCDEEKDGELVVSKVFYQTQPRQNVATAATVEQQKRKGDQAAKESSEVMQDVLPDCAATATAVAVVMMQQRPKQADSQFSIAPSKMSHQEVSVADQVVGGCGQGGEQHDNFHIPQNHLRSDLNPAPVRPTSSLVCRSSSPFSTVILPAKHHDSIVMDNQLRSPGILLQNAKIQASSTQSQQTHKWPYQHWPPDDKQDQHG